MLDRPLKLMISAKSKSYLKTGKTTHHSKTNKFFAAFGILKVYYSVYSILSVRVSRVYNSYISNITFFFLLI